RDELSLHGGTPLGSPKSWVTGTALSTPPSEVRDSAVRRRFRAPRPSGHRKSRRKEKPRTCQGGSHAGAVVACWTLPALGNSRCITLPGIERDVKPPARDGRLGTSGPSRPHHPAHGVLE